MTPARNTLVSLDATPYYPCTSRSARHAWQCDEDSYTGQSFEYRRLWVLERLRKLSGIFIVNLEPIHAGLVTRHVGSGYSSS